MAGGGETDRLAPKKGPIAAWKEADAESADCGCEPDR